MKIKSHQTSNNAGKGFEYDGRDQSEVNEIQGEGYPGIYLGAS